MLKHALAFPMFGAYAWLVWVLAQQAGSSALATLLAVSVVLGFAAWLYGIAQQRRFQGKGHRSLFAVTGVLAVAVIAPLAGLIQADSVPPGAQTVATAESAAENGHRRPSRRSAATAKRSLLTSPPPGVSLARLTKRHRFQPRP